MTALKYPNMRDELLEFAVILSAESVSRYEFDEAIHFLFDDTSIASDHSRTIGVFTADEREARSAADVALAIDAFLTQYGTEVDVTKHLKSEEWAKVRDKASALKIVLTSHQ